MKEELENELYNIDPVFFGHAINCKTGIENEMTTCMYWGCECGDGWFKPLKKFIQKVAIINELGKKYNIQFVCDQLKEKWGELTVYYSSTWADESNKNLIDINQCNILEEMFEEALHTAEKECWNVCEWCGAEGGYKGENLVTTSSGWISRICKKCAKEKAEKDTKIFDKNNKKDYIPRITWFHEGYYFLNLYYPEGFRYNNVYYSSVIEAFYSIKDKKHEKFYKEISYLNKKESTKFIESLANEFGIFMKDTKEDYILLKDLVKARFISESNNDSKKELLETEGKLLQNMGKHHNNIYGYCICEECKNKEHKDLYSKILMEIRNELKEIK